MADELPSAETIDDALAQGNLRHAPPGETAEEARRRSCARMRQEAAKPPAKSNGHAPRLNGSNGHAPADQTNWAQVIGQVAAETELRCERQIAALKEQVADLVAKSKSGGGLTDGEITALAKGLVPYLNERLAETAAPLSARLNEIETVVRTLVQSVAGRHE